LDVGILASRAALYQMHLKWQHMHATIWRMGQRMAEMLLPDEELATFLLLIL